MMFASEVDKLTGNETFSFFDPNLGVYYFDNVDECKNFIDCLTYAMEIDKSDNDYKFYLSVYMKNDNKGDY
ncbi:MAG: hypothetical protein ACL7BU_12315 [Candidatus Phlomobacter fragariae]